MIKIHIGLKGTGKTKNLINDVNGALALEKGNVVCITEGNRLMHDIDREARLVNTEQFDIRNFDMFEGLLCGIIAQNFDITHIFIDNLCKLLGNDASQAVDFCQWCEVFGEQNNLKFTIAISDDPDSADERLRKYF